MAEVNTADRPTTRAARVLLRLDRAAHRPWFLPAVAVFPLSDFVLPVLPNQMLLMTLGALHPRRWRALALTFIVATSLGALLVAIAVQTAGPWLLDTIGLNPDQGAIRDVTRGIERNGLWMLVGLSLLPWTPRTAVLVCVLVGISPWAIAAAVMAGRLVAATALTLIGAKAPHLLRRLRSVDRVLSEVEARRVGIR
jgi:uncharacterized membrane protein YdjX (TVP38/TMEM64 family)